MGPRRITGKFIQKKSFSLLIISEHFNSSRNFLKYMAKKPVKKVASTPAKSSVSEFDRVFDNFRKELEKSFSSFPRMDFSSFPKLHNTGCDVIDEGKQIRMKMNMPGLKKNEINLNVTDNSIEVSNSKRAAR